jgi:hypothetical protein
MQPIEIVEELKIRLAAQISCDTQQAVGLQPEVVGGKVIDRRIHQQDFRRHNDSVRALFADRGN